MPAWQYKKGLHEIGSGAYAYLQPNGGWGLANSGLIVDGDQSLLVDTLVDAAHTRRMLDTIGDATGLRATDIRTVVNTHHDADHTFGNFLMKHAEIIASKAAAETMAMRSPQEVATLKRNAPTMGSVGEYLLAIFSAYDWEDVELQLPTRTFEGELHIEVGGKRVHLIQVGPAHTVGDTLVHCPDQRIVYTGDILFIEGTPIIWAGPVSRWIAACERIMALDVDIVVPGHGPITDKSGAAEVRDYLRFVDREARKRYDAGLTVEEAVEDIGLGRYARWIDAERVVVNVQKLYEEYGWKEHKTFMQLFDLMGLLWRRRQDGARNGA